RFQTLKDKRDPLGLVDVLALSELAPLIEAYIEHKNPELLKSQLENLFNPYLPRDWKEVILGCTHYPIIQSELENLLGAKCISPADRVVDQIGRKLAIDTAQHQSASIQDFSFEYQNTGHPTWRKAFLSEFLPWYLI
ncbi:MAG: aspartate/glutamate racemase family protein, partial [Halobacteriovoraceae bacterium]|nr:aspartate/glutamate racemase family protein [Halobacteriovoraceae bacterium]